MPEYKASLPKTGFDVGRDFYFTSSIGMMLPIYHDVLNQGESIRFSVNMKTLLQPLKRPVQMHLRQKVDLFFVPMQMICTWFGQQFYQTNDFVSSLIDTREGGSLPQINIGTIFSQWYDSPDNLNTRGPLGDTLPFSLRNPCYFDVDIKGSFRLLMHLGYNANSVFAGVESVAPGITGKFYSQEFNLYQPQIFPAALLAYQAIYHNYYRLDDRFERNVKDYNLDYYDGDTSVVPKSMFALRYHARIKDYYTSLKVSPIYSSLNLSNGLSSAQALSAINNYLDDNKPYPADDSGARNTNIPTTRNKDFSQYGSSSFLITTGAIRSLFAVEKLNRIVGRARKNYDSQTLAHLGFNVPRDVKHEISFIGSIDGGVGVRTIQSLANTANGDSGAELGELAGTGEGTLSSSHPLKFTAPCHGILMAVFYSVPETSYTIGASMEKINQLNTRLDFYQPEFDKLGMQPLYAYEAIPYNLRSFYFADESDTPDFTGLESMPLGWQYRYEQYKRKTDVHSIAFYRPRTISDLGETEIYNSWSPWVLGAKPYDMFDMSIDLTPKLTDINVNKESFLVSPTYLDDLFVQSYNPFIGLPQWNADDDEIYFDTDSIRDYVTMPWLMFQTDPFMHAARIDCLKVSTMSIYGEPELD